MLGIWTTTGIFAVASIVSNLHSNISECSKTLTVEGANACNTGVMLYVTSMQ